MIKGNKTFDDFTGQRLPIFWIIGASKSGKTSVAHFLSECFSFRLLHTTYMTASHMKLAQAPETVGIIKTEIKNTCKYCQGYIVDGYPNTKDQEKLFVEKISKPMLVIYVCLSLDAALGRMLVQRPACDLNAARIDYVLKTRFAEKVYKKYVKNNSALKLYSQYPMQETHAKLLESLESDFGFKLRQVVV